MSHSRFTSLSAFALLGAAGAVACSDTRTTAPNAASSQAALTIASSDSLAFAGALGDISDRIEPTLGTGAEAVGLHAALARVATAVAAHDGVAVETAVAGGETALPALANLQTNAPADQDLDAVRLVLVQARALLASPTATSGAPRSR